MLHKILPEIFDKKWNATVRNEEFYKIDPKNDEILNFILLWTFFM